MKIIRSSTPKLFFSRKEKHKIINAIRQAEKNTSGEIRLHLERRPKGEMLACAKRTFEKLGMANTEKRNGVLIFMGVKNRRFAIIGDKGIHEKVPLSFWNDAASLMERYFAENRFADGLSEGIKLVGEKLKTYFPYQRDDIDELPNVISYSL